MLRKQYMLIFLSGALLIGGYDKKYTIEDNDTVQNIDKT